MNITYIPGASAAETPDMDGYIRRGTEINMASRKIVNCAPGTDDDDVVTLRGQSAYYRKGLPLEMDQRQIKNLADATEPRDAVTLRQARSGLPLEHIQIIVIDPGDPSEETRQVRVGLVLKTKKGIVRRNRYGTTILLRCNSAIPLALYVRTRSDAYVQEPLSVRNRSEGFILTPMTFPFATTFAFFTTREASFEGQPYIFHYLFNEASFVEQEPSADERAAFNPL